MRLYLEIDIKIARLAAVGGGLTIAALTKRTVLIHACGDIYGEARFNAPVTLTLAVGALFEYLFTRTAAVGAGAHLNGAPEQRILLIFHPARAAAARTLLIFCAAARTRAVARTAGFIAEITYLF